MPRRWRSSIARRPLFFSNVSHEFRTPLTLLLGTDGGGASTSDGSLQGEDLEAVYRNAQRLLKLVNTLLDFSRIEAGRVQASFEPTDLARTHHGSRQRVQIGDRTRRARRWSSTARRCPSPSTSTGRCGRRSS